MQHIDLEEFLSLLDSKIENMSFDELADLLYITMEAQVDSMKRMVDKING